MTPMSRAPVMIAATSGSQISLPWGDLVQEIVPAALTTGAFASYQVLGSATARRPAYIDHAADEAFVVLGGSVTFTVSEETFADLGPGAAVYVPRGAQRSFRTGPEGARLLLTQTPGQDAEAVRRLVPPPAAGRAIEAFIQLAAALRSHGVELVPFRASSPHPLKENS